MTIKEHLKRIVFVAIVFLTVGVVDMVLDG